jgi:hypothetical protein
MWECGGQPYDEEHSLHVTTGVVTYRELNSAGIEPSEFGCRIRADHKHLLRDRLQSQGFDVAREIMALEVPSGD